MTNSISNLKAKCSLVNCPAYLHCWLLLFHVLVFFSAIVAFPLSWWFMHKWLQSYEYRITISWWVFVLAGLLALLIALVTISFQTVRAAIANPVKSLRTE